MSLIKSLRPYIEIVQNDGTDHLLEEVKENFALSNTDALHMATAIEKGCVCIRTLDRDFCGINAKKLDEFGKRFGLDKLFVNDKPPRG